MGLPDDPWWILVAVLALAGLALLAYAVRALDWWGAGASFLLGLLVAWMGGLGWVLLMVVFTGLAFVATLAGRTRKKAMRLEEAHGGERGLRNVVGNGAAAGLMALSGLIPAVPASAASLAFATALAAVAADTLASEIGVLARRARNILPPFRPVPVGVNGGVSFLGQLSAAFGAGALGVAAVPLAGIPWEWAWLPVAAGFVGCQIDSILGATVEGDAARPGRLGKQEVNFLASLAPSLAVLVVFSLWPIVV